ncbi:alpha/beta hydrolase [Streptosporangium roseum]|uniref:Esterase/lipase-like protein n=1 Tax=Streptosporangium roseum (strain ATCC 12428 / DSM 43021 / JCM 3005 / KCTC 9067 / NCIMB 10171 / NRRL 2505 / NI 9100) TaxID=479432 RepID=D2B0J5_STRRD|nr:alpha/beta hydrolase [Streptosporangium roseum]ACZ91007.1 Esterase/lipase-like protein [Streptosporangium roseum DSM 43021]
MRTAVTVSALALAALVIGPTAVHASPAAHATSAPSPAGAKATAEAASATKTRATTATARTEAATGSAATAKTASAGAAGKGDPTPTPTPVPTPSPTSTPATDPLLQDVSVDTVSYGPHVRQRMDVWHHSDGVGHPGVFLIHGGWWSSGDKKYMTALSRSYVEQGYTVFNINYRLSGDAAWPAQRTDTLDAIATARRHALLWGFDSSNYVVIGFSAGGHLAAAAGTYKNSGLPGLRGVVGISPVISPLTAYNEGTDTVDANRRKLRESAIRLAGGCEPDKCPRIWNSMEVPLHASSGDVPVLSVHSQDEFVPAEHSVRLRDRLARFGVNMTVLTEPGIEHSSPLYRLPGVAETVHAWVAAKLL